MSLESYAWSVFLITMGINVLVAIYGIVYRPTLTKKLIALTILSDTVFLLFLSTGFRFTHPLVPPVLLDYSNPGEVGYLADHASDPLPQALVLTGIVIGLAINSLIAFGIIQIHRLTGSIDVRKVIPAYLEAEGEE